MKSLKVLKWVFLGLSVAINLFIIVNACLNGDISGEESGRVSRWFTSIINSFSPNLINDGNFNAYGAMFRKLVGHFGVFVLNGIFTTMAVQLFLKDSKFGQIVYSSSFSLGFGLIVAAISEFIQIFTPDRYGTFADIGIDFGGYFLGFLLASGVLFYFDLVSLKKEKLS